PPTGTPTSNGKCPSRRNPLRSIRRAETEAVALYAARALSLNFSLRPADCERIRMRIVHLTASTFFGGPQRQMARPAPHFAAHVPAPILVVFRTWALPRIPAPGAVQRSCGRSAAVRHAQPAGRHIGIGSQTAHGAHRRVVMPRLQGEPDWAAGGATDRRSSG